MKKIEIFKIMEEFDYEQLVFFQDKKTGLKGITGIHDTKMGPALGGTRLWDYKSEDEAIEDVLRLSRGMSYKAAAANLQLGGGKTVLIGKPEIKTPEYMQMLGNYVESLNGRYITAEDININTSDCAEVNKNTGWVVGLKEKSGNPSPVTAWGAFKALEATLEDVWGSKEYTDKTFAVQGAGQTGYFLTKYLLGYTVEDFINNTGKPSGDKKAKKIYFTEINEGHIARMAKEHPEVEFVKPDDIYGLDVDVFVPCAMGKVINDKTIPQFKCKAICGTSNNVLDTVEHAEQLKAKGIQYAPDYVANGAGLINVANELTGYDWAKAKVAVEGIYDTIKGIYKIAKDQDITSAKAADVMAENRMAEAASKRKTTPRKMMVPSIEGQIYKGNK